MKLLLVILGVIIAVNGTPVESNHISSEADYRNIADELLNQVKSLKEGVEQLKDDVRHAINLKLKEIPEVKAVQDKYIKGLTDKSLDVECAVKVDMHYLETLEIITIDILKKSLQNATEGLQDLDIVQQGLAVMQKTLEENLDKEVQKCVKDSESCSITGQMIDKTDGLFKLVDLTKYKILSHAKNEVSSEDVQEKVKTYVANVPKCLTELKN